MAEDADNPDTLIEQTAGLLMEQVRLARAISGLIPAETAETIYNLACAYRELSAVEN